MAKLHDSKNKSAGCRVLLLCKQASRYDITNDVTLLQLGKQQCSNALTLWEFSTAE